MKIKKLRRMFTYRALQIFRVRQRSHQAPTHTFTHRSHGPLIFRLNDSAFRKNVKDWPEAPGLRAVLAD